MRTAILAGIVSGCLALGWSVPGGAVDGRFDTGPYAPGHVFTNEAEARDFWARWHERPVQPFRAPTQADLDAVRDPDKQARLNKAVAILTDTPREVGPFTADATRRHAANNLACANCHAPATLGGLPGTKPYVVPYVNVINDYPKLDPKSMTVISLRDRIAGMFGPGDVPIEHDSETMDLIVEYMTWLGSFAEPGQRMEGTLVKSAEALSLPDRPADPARGAELYAAQCASCHQADGMGMKKPDYDSGGGYFFPPVAGADSYDDGGHMFMIPKFASFIHSYMPLGASADAPILSVDDAYDIAAFVNSGDNAGSQVGLSRPHSPARSASYPVDAFRDPGFVLWEDLDGGMDDPDYVAQRFGPFMVNPLAE